LLDEIDFNRQKIELLLQVKSELKANLLFFNKKAKTKEIWYHGFATIQRKNTQRQIPLLMRILKTVIRNGKI